VEQLAHELAEREAAPLAGAVLELHGVGVGTVLQRVGDRRAALHHLVLHHGGIGAAVLLRGVALRELVDHRGANVLHARALGDARGNELGTEALALGRAVELRDRGAGVRRHLRAVASAPRLAFAGAGAFAAAFAARGRARCRLATAGCGARSHRGLAVVLGRAGARPAAALVAWWSRRCSSAAGAPPCCC
jgi:hypothetical protein